MIIEGDIMKSVNIVHLVALLCIGIIKMPLRPSGASLEGNQSDLGQRQYIQRPKEEMRRKARWVIDS